MLRYCVYDGSPIAFVDDEIKTCPSCQTAYRFSQRGIVLCGPLSEEETKPVGFTTSWSPKSELVTRRAKELGIPVLDLKLDRSLDWKDLLGELKLRGSQQT